MRVNLTEIATAIFYRIAVFYFRSSFIPTPLLLNFILKFCIFEIVPTG